METTLHRKVPMGKFINYIIGAVFLISVVAAALVLYRQDIKPMVTAEQEQVRKSYTFTMRCKIQQPITGLFQAWLIGRDGQNAWTYVAGCLVESPDDIEIIDNGITPLLPKPQPGLTFVVIADSAPVSVIDWEKEFREAGYNLGDPNTVPPQKLRSYSFSHPDMRLYGLHLLPQNIGPDKKFKILCREAIDTSSDDPRNWRPYHLCSSN